MRRPNATSGMVSMSKTRQFMGSRCRAGWRPSCWDESWGGGAALGRSCRGRRRRGGSHQHGDRHDETGLVSQSYVPFADAQALADSLPALREDDFRFAPGVLYYSYVADPDAMGEAG